MNTISIPTGLVTYDINGACQISFNPTDALFAERLYSAFDTLDTRQEDYQSRIEKAANTKAIFEVARALDAEMREIIDNTLGKGVSDALFKDMNVYAMADGLPVWANLFLALMDEMDTGYVHEQRKTSPRLDKYIGKYKK